MPIHRLEQKPTVAATLADLTCDSDGKIDRFCARPDEGASQPALFLHNLIADQPYHLSMFCTGTHPYSL